MIFSRAGVNGSSTRVFDTMEISSVRNVILAGKHATFGYESIR
jgi:hypothetical protein